MGSRLATDAEVETWRDDGWVLIEGLVSTDEIDATAGDLNRIVPDQRGIPGGPARRVTNAQLGHPARAKEEFIWPEHGPGFRPEQHIWQGKFPFPGKGTLNRLCVHPSIVDFAERALASTDIRLYQIHATAKYEGVINYEQPMHTDRNHSWLPAIRRAPWWNLEGFLYMTDVTESENPTAMVSVRQTRDQEPERRPVMMPEFSPDIYATRAAGDRGTRGSYLAYRSDDFHRGTAFRTPGTGRTVVALAWDTLPTNGSVTTWPSPGRRKRLDPVRRAVHPPGARATRVPSSGSRGVDRGTSR